MHGEPIVDARTNMWRGGAGSASDEDDGFPEQQRVVEYAADRVAPGGVVVEGESAHPRSV